MKKIIYFILIVFLFSGCKKYPEDNHSIHLHTVKKRLIRDWSIQAHNNPDISFQEDGRFWADSTIIGSPFGMFPLYLSIAESQATWELTNKKDNLRITNPYDNQIYEFSIERLEKNEDGILVLKLKNDSTSREYHELYNP